MPSLGFELRDCKAWLDAGLPMSTTSDRAAKMYDASISQYFAWLSDDSIGGMGYTLQAMTSEDPQFVMGHVVNTTMTLMGNGRGALKMADSKEQVAQLLKLSKRDDVTDREKLYVKATDLLIKGRDPEAATVYEDILDSHPTDPLALRLLYDLCFTYGGRQKMRDCVARVLPMWKKSMPLYGYLYGMHAFALQEMNQFDLAEKQGTLGVQWNRYDPWARHSLSHVYEMTKRPDKGIASLDSTVADWTHYDSLVCHNYWHWALFHIEKGEFEAALTIYDDHLASKGLDSSEPVYTVVDSSSCLRRLQYEGVKIGDRWTQLTKRSEQLLGDHYWPFVDIHLMLTYCGSGRSDVMQRMLASVQDFVRDNVTNNGRIYREVALPLMEGMQAYEQGDHQAAVQLIYPVRDSFKELGGSTAQGDIFWLILIHAAMSSPSPAHHKLARLMVNERRACVEQSRLDDRLLSRIMALHD